MKVTNEKTENRQAFLRIEVDPEEIETATVAAYRRLVKRVNVPGFRRGNAPRPVFERHFGKHELFHEALDDLVPDVYKKAVEEQKLDVISQPQIDVETESPLVLKAVVPLRPVVTLGDYHGIKLEKPKVEITDEMVDRVIERLQHQHATWEPVERASALSDMVVIDIDSSAKGEAFINRKGLEYQLTDEQAGPVPGFVGQLIGLKKDDEKEFTLKFPDDYFRKEVAGSDAVFKVKVSEVKREILPEINDQFAGTINKDFATVTVLREKIMEDMKERAEHDAEHDYEDKAIETATGLSQVEYPPVMLEAEIDHLLERNFRYIQQTGQDIERYLQTIGKTVDQMREELKPAAQKRVAESLVLGHIAEQEKLEVTPAEIDAEIEEMVKNSTGDKEALRKALSDGQNRESIENTLITRKVIKLLTGLAGGAAPEEKKPEEEEVKESPES